MVATAMAADGAVSTGTAAAVVGVTAAAVAEVDLMGMPAEEGLVEGTLTRIATVSKWLTEAVVGRVLTTVASITSISIRETG